MRIAISLFLLLEILLPARVSATENNIGIWGIFSATDAFHPEDGPGRWRYHLDAQVRYFDLGSGINQVLVRPGIGYSVNSNVSVWAGYAYLRTNTASNDSVTEDRFWQSVNWTAAKWDHGTLSMRARLEERMVSRGDDTGLVLRYMVKYVRPLRNAKNMDLVLAVEPFVDLRDTDWGGDKGLAQNRTTIGINWKFAAEKSLEFGYMNQYIWADNREDLVNHLAVVNFKMKF
jgi:hypothetical protein